MKKGYIFGIALILLCLGVAVYEAIMVVNGIHLVLNLILMCWNCILAGVTMGALRMFRTFAKLPSTDKYTIEFDIPEITYNTDATEITYRTGDTK